jgi:ABC-type branched-subunit amino acid transport system ATPase component
MPILSIENLTGGYGEIVIVTGLSLSLSQGQALCVTGRNGVGKSTLVRLVTGALRPASGRVVFEGADLTFAPAHGRARQGMGYAPQEGRGVRYSECGREPDAASPRPLAGPLS